MGIENKIITLKLQHIATGLTKLHLVASDIFKIFDSFKKVNWSRTRNTHPLVQFRAYREYTLLIILTNLQFPAAMKSIFHIESPLYTFKRIEEWCS